MFTFLEKHPIYEKVYVDSSTGATLTPPSQMTPKTHIPRTPGSSLKKSPKRM